MPKLTGRTAVVTGGTYGVGGGIARALATEGAKVFVTGRSAGDHPSLENVVPRRCDHRDDGEVAATFDRILGDTDGIDLLVNNVWGGYEMGRGVSFEEKRSVELISSERAP